MLIPVMPLFLTSIGFSALLIGILEGIAEASAGLSKGYFGKRSDVIQKRTPFVQVGYLLSAISKPMMAFLSYPLWIFFSKTLDKFGKGIRTGARDALLSDEATPQTKGKVFGFHRAMDTTGAVIGPALALLYLYYHPQDYRTLFYITAIPGLLVIISTLFIKEKKREQKSTLVTRPSFSFFAFIKYWKTSPTNYRKLAIGLLIFTLFNSSDMFLLLKAKEAGLNDTEYIGVYIFFNLVYALFAFPAGIIADKKGLKAVYIFGLIMFAMVYFGMSFTKNIYFIIGLFFLYGLYAATSDGISKAWITNIANKKDTATAIGTFTAFQSICMMIANILAGVLWYHFGPPAAFIATGTVTVLVVIYFLFAVPYQKVQKDEVKL